MKKKQLSKELRFECQQTGRCCMSRGQEGFVYVTSEDRKRLARFLGLQTAVFTRKFCVKTDGFYHLKDPELDCMFLADRRCSVYDARPMQCRTWPFWPENLNARGWNQKMTSHCAGIGKGKAFSLEEIKLELLKMETSE